MMKTCVVLLLLLLHQTTFPAFAQQVTIRKTPISLNELFKEIRKQTGYNIFYASKILDDKKEVYLSAETKTLRDVLSAALNGTGVGFVIEEKGIILSRQQVTALATSSASEPNPILSYEIKGKVLDENNQPLSGVTVQAVEGVITNAAMRAVAPRSSSTITNHDGTFALTVKNNADFLYFSYVGMETTAIRIGDQRNFTVTLNPAKNALDIVQVVAYGSTTKRYTTGTVASVKSEDIRKQPVSNPLQALSGRVAGVYITEGAGVAGASINMQIRGQNTIGGGQAPLYIVDGVPFSSVPTETSAGTYSLSSTVGSAGTFSPFENIPASDIESIEILKDADATALYGSRAANGVVIITTKKGSAGTMKATANVYSGTSQITNQVKMLNTQQYLAVRQKAFENDNITPAIANAPDLLSFGTGQTDYVKYIMGNTARLTDATADVSGGSKLTQYLISTNYRHQSSVFPDHFADNKTTVRFNVQSKSEDGKFSINFSGGYTKNNNNLPTTTITSVYALPPNLPLYNADGSFYWNNNYTNPAAALLGPSSIKTDNILANSSLRYTLFPGLSFKTDVGFNRINLDIMKATTKVSRNPNLYNTGTVIMSNNYTQIYTVEPQLNFNRQVGAGKLDVLLGGTYQDSKSVQPFFIYGTFTNDALYSNFASVKQILSGSGYTDTKYVSAFSRINYNIDGKYILSLNGRRDGSSRFGPDKRFGNFGSVGGAWIFSAEKFVEHNLPWLSFGKLRSSYGTVGNNSPKDYQYLSLYASNSLAPSYNSVAALNPSSPVIKDFQWEVTRKLELAMDLNFIKDHIAFSAAWFRNRSNNLLVSIPLASQTGFTTYLGNLPALVQNKGLEFTLETKNMVKKNFTWTTNVNLTLIRNKLVSFPGLASSTYADSYVVGQSLNVVQNYHLIGFKGGIAQFQDLDGNGTISAGSYTTTGTGDYKISGNTDPKYYGGISNSFTYKGFQLDFLFSFVKKMGYNIYNSLSAPGTASNTIADVLNKPFQYTTLSGSAAGQAFSYYSMSDAAFGDASFIRLKNASLSYTFDNKLIRHTGLKNLNLYLRAQNVLTITKYLGYDPETLGTSIPPLKIYTIGLQTSL